MYEYQRDMVNSSIEVYVPQPSALKENRFLLSTLLPIFVLCALVFLGFRFALSFSPAPDGMPTCTGTTRAGARCGSRATHHAPGQSKLSRCSWHQKQLESYDESKAAGPARPKKQKACSIPRGRDESLTDYRKVHIGSHYSGSPLDRPQRYASQSVP